MQKPDGWWRMTIDYREFSHVVMSVANVIPDAYLNQNKRKHPWHVLCSYTPRKAFLFFFFFNSQQQSWLPSHGRDHSTFTGSFMSRLCRLSCSLLYCSPQNLIILISLKKKKITVFHWWHCANWTWWAASGRYFRCLNKKHAFRGMREKPHESLEVFHIVKFLGTQGYERCQEWVTNCYILHFLPQYLVDQWVLGNNMYHPCVRCSDPFQLPALRDASSRNTLVTV